MYSRGVELTRRRIYLLGGAVLIGIGGLIGLYFAWRAWAPFDVDDVERWIEDLGPWGPVVYILGFGVSMLFAPIPTAPLPVAAAAVWGGVLGFAYTLTAVAIGSALCFWVARTLGRRALRRLMTEAAVEKLDEYGQRLGVKVLIVARLVPLAGVDYVSYAAGLTQMPFRVYIVISVLGSAPILALASVLGEGLRRNLILAAAAAVVLLLVFAAPVAWQLWRRRQQAALEAMEAGSVGPDAD